jgi:hypothetical protein
MIFKKIFVAVILIFCIFSVPTTAKDRPTWLIELPRVMCLNNKVWLVWVQYEYPIQVTGIFCSLDEDLI